MQRHMKAKIISSINNYDINRCFFMRINTTFINFVTSVLTAVLKKKKKNKTF